VLIALTCFEHHLKGLLEGFQMQLEPWELLIGIDKGIFGMCIEFDLYGGNRILDKNINVLYCPYKSRYHQVKESKSPSRSTIVCN